MKNFYLLKPQMFLSTLILLFFSSPVFSQSQLEVSGLSPFSAPGSSADVTVTANVGWTATTDDTWITMDINSGSGNATVSVMVSENTEEDDRVGAITFTEDAGGDDIVVTLTVTQAKENITDQYELINVGTGQPTDLVTIHSFSREEVNGVDKFNYAANTLDKDNGSVWAADDGDIVPGDFRGDGEFIIFDLTDLHSIDLIQYTTTNKADAFGYQIWVSTTGTEDADFTRVLPTTGELLFTAINTTDFNQYELESAVEARYIKLVGFGRYNAAGDTRVSIWSAIGEIEFYGTSLVSTSDIEFTNHTLIYPVPAQDVLHLENANDVNLISVYSMDGRKVLDKNLSGFDTEIDLNISSIPNGSYFIILKGEAIYQRELFTIQK